MEREPKIARIGVLLAAGRGRRMGRTKQLVPWRADDEDKPLVAAAFDAIAPVCEAMVVVLGHETDAVAAALANRPFKRVSSDPDAPMFASVRRGIETAIEINPGASVFLHPADHPTVSRETLHALIDAAAKHPSAAIIPQHNGAGGHPVLIPAERLPAILKYNGAGGLQAHWASEPAGCVRVPVEDAGVLLNVNTPTTSECDK